MAPTSIPTEKQQNWLKIIAEAADSGLTLKEFAEQKNIPAQRLYSWKSQLQKKGLLPALVKKSNFVKVNNPINREAVDKANERTTASPLWIKVTLRNGITVELPELSHQSLQVLSAV